MSDIVITPADVGLVSAVSGVFVQFGEAVSAGETVYLDSTSGKYYLADADDSAKDSVAGVVISAGGAADGYGYIANGTGVVLTIGGTTTAGQVYVLSNTAGGIMPESDLTTGQYVSVVGVGDTGNKLVLGINNSGVQHA